MGFSSVELGNFESNCTHGRQRVKSLKTSWEGLRGLGMKGCHIFPPKSFTAAKWKKKLVVNTDWSSTQTFCWKLCYIFFCPSSDSVISFFLLASSFFFKMGLHETSRKLSCACTDTDSSLSSPEMGNLRLAWLTFAAGKSSQVHLTYVPPQSEWRRIFVSIW